MRYEKILGKCPKGEWSRSHLYNVWHSLHYRCSSPKADSYRMYGERGIKVAEEWNTFPPFYIYVLQELGERPSVGHSLDRIDSNGNYEPGNIRWATASEQARNTRRNNNITMNGETHCITEWCEILGSKPSIVWHRLEDGWPPEEAFDMSLDPYKNRRVRIELDEKVYTFQELSALSGLSVACLRQRYKKLGLRGKELLQPKMKIVGRRGNAN